MSLKEGIPTVSSGRRVPYRSAHRQESPLTTSLTDAWPSSATFDLIASALDDDAERKDAIKKGGAIFAFTLKNDQGEQKDWHIDLKESGKVGKGSAPDGKKANGKHNAGSPVSFGLPSLMRLRQ